MQGQVQVLGINGSPRRGGNTDILLTEFLKGATAEGAKVDTMYLNKMKITGCQHCDACLEVGDCRIKDDMQAAYKELEWADCIVLAAPIHFMGLSAQAKLMIDRCQSLWARKYVLKVPPLGSAPGMKKGFFLSVGGTKFKDLFEPAIVTVKALFTCLDIEYTGELVFSGIDEKGAIERHPDAMSRAFQAGQEIVKSWLG